MSSATGDRLYSLLPAVYRVRDLAQGEPLRALLALIDQQYGAIERNITGLYENWFIETCAEWVVPYIGDLLQVRPLYPASPGTYSQRAYVANTLNYRRSKGTAAMLEQLAFDVTGWPAHVVEFFELLSTSQFLNHLRPQNKSTPDLRDSEALELLGGPFETAAHTVDVRHINNGRGRYNIPNVGIFLWRLKSYRVQQSDARVVANPADGRYTFDPLGIGAPLFNAPQTQTGPGGRTAEINLPAPLRRSPLYDELEARRQAIADQQPAPLLLFGVDPIFQISIAGAPVPFEQIQICDIEEVSPTDWRRPASTKQYMPANGGPAIHLPIALSADPVRGRIAFPTGVIPDAVTVSYAYGFSGDVGAGTYDRNPYLSASSSAPGPLLNPQRWQVGVSRDLTPDTQLRFTTVADAVDAWHSQPVGTDGVIALLDSHTYTESVSITIPQGSRLLLLTADWPALRAAGTPQSLNLDAHGLRPHLRGGLAVSGTASQGGPNQGQLFIDGLLIEGQLTVTAGNLGALSVSHSTLVSDGGLSIAAGTGSTDQNDALKVTLYRTISGPFTSHAKAPSLSLTDSIVGAIAGSGATLNVQSCTVFGSASATIIDASDSVFTGLVIAERRQAGCVRFCSLPVASQTARRYRCQPDLALTAVTGADAQQYVEDRLTPQFTSLDLGQPGYAQLAARCPLEIATGADDQAEMGVFRYLQQPPRQLAHRPR
jgi:hypothetical protein